MKKQSPFMALGIVMLGVVMRAPFTALPAVLSDIAADLGVGVSDLGLLTAIPLMMFALCSSWAPLCARKIGMEKLMALSLFLMAVGSLLRMTSLLGLYLGTVWIGIATAMINVLLPSLVARYYPEKIGFFTTMYVTALGLAGAGASMVAVPIVAATSWKIFVLCLSLVIALALLLWLPTLSQPKVVEEVEKQQVSSTSIWKNKGAWVFLMFGGLQSLLFYTEMTWLPTISQVAGLSQEEAGFLLGIFSFVSIPVSLLIPGVVSRLTSQGRMFLMVGFSALTLFGLALIPFSSDQFSLWFVIHIVLGTSTGALFPYMMLSFSLKTSSSQATAQLSGMVQTGGYCIAAVGPALLGYSYPLFGSWLPLLVVLFLVTILMIGTIYWIEKEEIIH